MMPGGREQARNLLTRRSRHARFASRVIPDANGFERAICALRGRLAITLQTFSAAKRVSPRPT